jgi:hypothetical protein
MVTIVKRKKVQDLEQELVASMSPFIGSTLNNVSKAALLKSLGLSLESFKQDLMDEQALSEVPQEAIMAKVQPMSPPQDLVYYIPLPGMRVADPMRQWLDHKSGA